jgi:hypothetical protein
MRFLIDLPMPFDPTDRLEDFLRKATASGMQDDPVVQAAIYRVQDYLRDRLTPSGASEGDRSTRLGDESARVTRG